MKIAAVTRGGVLAVQADTRGGLFSTLHSIDVAFDDGAFVRIPGGFVFDGASVPGALRSLVPSLTAAGSVAFVVHDYAYRAGARYIAANGKRIPISRQRADWMALALCDWLGFPCDEALRVYAGLRIGGAAAYRAKPL